MALGKKFYGTVASGFSGYCLEQYKKAKESNSFDKHLIAFYDKKFRRAKDISVADNPLIFSTIQGIFREANKDYKFVLHEHHIDIWIMEYTEGAAGYVDWHVDFEGKSLADNAVGEQIKLSMSLALTEDYKGGELEFDEGRVELGTNDLVVFPSFFRHKVNPVKQGTRVALVAWQYGPNWK